jgi:CxxC motif-containing protein (DUF1111 family)
LQKGDCLKDVNWVVTPATRQTRDGLGFGDLHAAEHGCRFLAQLEPCKDCHVETASLDAFSMLH